MIFHVRNWRRTLVFLNKNWKIIFGEGYFVGREIPTKHRVTNFFKPMCKQSDPGDWKHRITTRESVPGRKPRSRPRKRLMLFPPLDEPSLKQTQNQFAGHRKRVLVFWPIFNSVIVNSPPRFLSSRWWTSRAQTISSVSVPRVCKDLATSMLTPHGSRKRSWCCQFHTYSIHANVASLESPLGRTPDLSSHRFRWGCVMRHGALRALRPQASDVLRYQSPIIQLSDVIQEILTSLSKWLG